MNRNLALSLLLYGTMIDSKRRTKIPLRSYADMSDSSIHFILHTPHFVAGRNDKLPSSTTDQVGKTQFSIFITGGKLCHGGYVNFAFRVYIGCQAGFVVVPVQFRFPALVDRPINNNLQQSPRAWFWVVLRRPLRRR
jgi:hypothetical protein